MTGLTDAEVPVTAVLALLAVLALFLVAAWRRVVRPLRDLAAPADGPGEPLRPRRGAEVAGVRHAIGVLAARLEAEERRTAERATVLGPFGVALASAATVDEVRAALLRGARVAFAGHGATLASRTLDGRYVEVIAEDAKRRWGTADDLVVGALDEVAPLVARAPDGLGWQVAFGLRDPGRRHALAVQLPGADAPPAIDGILVEQLGSLAAGALARAEVADREHEISVVLQSALLPDRFPEVEGLDIASRFRPQSQDGLVGGDVLDVQEFADGRLALFVGDVSGKGAQAAGFAAVARSEVRAISVRERDPAAALAAVDRVLTSSAHRSGRHVTAALAYVQPTARGVEVVLATAGHPPALLLDAGRWRLLRPEPAPPLGTSLGVGRAVTHVLAPGDTIVLFTDGLTEARAPERVDRPEDLPALLGDVDSIEEALDRLMAHVTPAGTAMPRDDVALLALAVPGARGRSARVA